ncbi:helix-turn-helix transcriptional regulator [Kibdelosporangium aridum]|uniref:helix-turn-helix transcriptional regulator n=1 Tax=Kibdelosporangium aridum TaxID=2030 RepID=UPI0035EB2818
MAASRRPRPSSNARRPCPRTTPKRVDRTLAAAQAKLDAGATDAAAALLTTVELKTLDERTQAKADLLRGQVAFVRHGDSNGPTFMLHAARRLADIDPAWSRTCFLDALEMAMVVGRGSGVMDMVLNAARSAPPATDFLDALVLLNISGHKAAVPALRDVLADSAAWTRRPALATMVAGELWDIDAHTAIVDWLMKTGRQSGAPMVLRLGLAQGALEAALTGDLPKAVDAIAEEEALADAIGTPSMTYPRLFVTALRGRREEATELIETATTVAKAKGIGQLVANVHWSAAVLHNGLGDYPAALAMARQAAAAGDLFLAGAAMPELVEAAVRCGENDLAASALESLTERTQASGTPWGLGLTAYSRGMVTGDEDDYRAAIELLADSPGRTYQARAHLLYGEWLRRQNRRLDARTQLRTAHDLLSTIGMEAFARRASDELRATGAQARSRATNSLDELTMQETHIARLVATGATSKEVAARLFLSPRTIDAHLRNIFRKLGITSRRQLRDLPDLR